MASSVGVHDSVVRAGFWDIFRSEKDQKVDDIPFHLFTHLYVAVAKINPDGHIAIPWPYSEQFQELTRLARCGSVKIILSIVVTDENQAAILSEVVRDERKQINFITDSKKFHLDGLDISWLYPSKPEHEELFRALLYALRYVFPKPFLLTAAVFHHPVHKSFNYPIQAIKDNLDWINVLAIDFYTPSNSSARPGPVHAWLNPTEPKRCGSDGIRNWNDENRGVATKQLVLGLPYYGYEWILKNSNNTGFFASAHPANASAHPANKSSKITYRAIKEKQLKENYLTVYDSNYVATYSINFENLNWIGYDDERCISEKVKRASGCNFKLGGYFAWDLSGDDKNWTLSNAAFKAWKGCTKANEY